VHRNAIGAVSLSNKKKLTILYVHASTDLYGSDKVLLDLVKNIDKALFAPIVVLPDRGPLFYAIENEGIEVHDLPLARITRSAFTVIGILKLVQRLLVSIKAITKLVGSRKIDIVHSNTLAVISGAFWALLNRTKHLWHVHEIIERPNIIYRYYPKLVNVLSSYVVANSNATRNWLETKAQQICGKTETIHNGLTHEGSVSKLESDTIRTYCNATNEDVVVVLVGRLNWWKGQELFIDAVEIMAEKGIRSVRALIVGSPPPGQGHFKSDLDEYISASKVAEFVSMMDFTEDVWPVWAACDIAVVPSTEPEPFGMVAIEAMSAHKPVIAANHGGLAEIVEHGITGLLVTPRDARALAQAIEELLLSSERRREMGEQGYLRQKNYFSLEAYIRAFEARYLYIVAH
jgi:glycosyltransferase involved in cell wall biosynthesis